MNHDPHDPEAPTGAVTGFAIVAAVAFILGLLVGCSV
jgi:hypothetical protein